MIDETGRLRLRALALPTLVLLAALASTGCESSSTTTTATGPSNVKCQVAAVTNTANPIEATGGTHTISVTTQPECAWDVSTQASWIVDVSPRTGQGTGQVSYTVEANPVPSMREGEIVINASRVQVRQAAAACHFELGQMSADIAAAGGSGTTMVTTFSACTWTAASSVNWITVTPSSGTGNGSLSFTVARNDGSDRVGAILIAGLSFTVRQAGQGGSGGGDCTYRISPTTQSFGIAGGTGIVGVLTANGCPWTASSTAAWLTILRLNSTTGNGTVEFSVAPNSGGARNAALVISGQTFAVNQAGANCAYSISPAGTTVPAAGGTSAVAVTTSSGCMWTAVSNVQWISITSGASGTGNGTVGFSASANTGVPRTGTITIAGQTFTVQQGTSCTYGIAPTSNTFPAAGGAATVAVTAPAGCTWTATTNVQWITLTSASGSGNGSVAFTVAPNMSGSGRNGTITVGGQTFTATQQ